MAVIEKQLLIMFDTKANCNKFYELSLNDDSSVFVRYGRVGQKGQTKDYTGGKGKFMSLLRAKMRKGYKEAQIEDGSSDNSSAPKENVIDIALKQIRYKDKMSEALIRAIADANIHRITGNTNITYDKDDGLFKTPLGIVRKNAVLKAMALLDEMRPYIDKNETRGLDSYDEDKLFSLNEDYFILIPNKVKNAREKRHLVFNDTNWKNQKNICASLLETLDLLEDLKLGKGELKKEAKEEELPEIFDVEVEHVDDKTLINKISKMYEQDKNSMHGNRIMNSKIANVYKIKLGSQHKAFEKAEKEIGNVQLLWHGTRICNTLSIMSKGLLLPSISPGQKAGAMFGHGLYFANQSSKSVQYCDGLFWASGSRQTNKVYMFLASVAMGKAFTPKGSTQSKPPAGYDSYWAKAGVSGVRNDEIIVFDTKQVRLDYLIEITL